MLTSGVTQAPSTDVHRGEVADAPGGKYYLHIPPSSNLHIPIFQLKKTPPDSYIELHQFPGEMGDFFGTRRIF